MQTTYTVPAAQVRTGIPHYMKKSRNLPFLFKELWRKCFTIFCQGHRGIDIGFCVQDWWQMKDILCAHVVGKSVLLQRV